jgi:hypothetical protein
MIYKITFNNFLKTISKPFMNINLLELVQQNLGYPQLPKIDASTDLVGESGQAPAVNEFSQAAIPVVVTAIYQVVQSDDGADDILHKIVTTDWVNILFEDNSKAAMDKIAFYGASQERTRYQK